MLRLCPERFLRIDFRKALPCFPILICSQSVFSHHTGSLLLLLLPIFSKFIFNLVQWLIPRRALFNKMRNLFSLDKVFMGEEDFKVVQGGKGKKKKRQLFSFKEEQHVFANQKDFCSLRLKTLESPLQGGYHLRGSPSSLLPTPLHAALGANEVYPWAGIAASPGSKPSQPLSPLPWEAGQSSAHKLDTTCLLLLPSRHGDVLGLQSVLDQLWEPVWGQTCLAHPA